MERQRIGSLGSGVQQPKAKMKTKEVAAVKRRLTTMVLTHMVAIRKDIH